MPTYDYICDKCGLQFEKFQSMKDPALATCPKEVCGQKRWGKGKVRRVLGTGAGLIFKGSGFYITDYKNKSGGAKKEGGESKAADSKPAAPATTSSSSTTTATAKKLTS